MQKGPLLLVDDDEVTLKLLKEVFESEGYVVAVAQSAEEALKVLPLLAPQVILTDIRMKEVDGMSLMQQVRRLLPNCVVILMTGFGDMEGAIAAIQKGAFDYVSKPFQIAAIKAVVEKAWAHHVRLEAEPSREPRPVFSDFQSGTLIGKSSALVEVFKMIARAAPASSNVLIIGESGTGKELVARAIHSKGLRTDRPFIPINCGALAENLLESELFGYEKGAFTGAVKEKPGLLEQAEGGTLFLDEIGDTTPGFQVKLLRFIQEGEFKRVGSNAIRRADVRVVAATHRNLDDRVKAGHFREDLLYRLRVIEIRMPPLRERKEDLDSLVRFFIQKYAKKNGKSISDVSDEAMEWIRVYDWPGNVRELENAIDRAVALTRTVELVLEDLPRELSALAARSPEVGEESIDTKARSLEEIEKEHILRVLKEAQYNKTRASEILKIDRATLYRKAQKYGIEINQ